MNESHYLNPEGKRIATAEYHRNRGTCCKSSCLHCPYGETLRRDGLKFKPLDGPTFNQAKDLLSLGEEEIFDVAKMLLAEGYGKKSSFPILSELNRNQFRLVELNGHECGVIHLCGDEVSNLLLHPRFRDQGLNREIVDGHYKRVSPNKQS
ncbi:MAG: hypothetical protein KAG61_08970 [Bacteriovoracaceae bacterium]|nr:hypothetical protein [Bacteriovoracaceae bacterium]